MMFFCSLTIFYLRSACFLKWTTQLQSSRILKSIPFILQLGFAIGVFVTFNSNLAIFFQKVGVIKSKLYSKTKSTCIYYMLLRNDICN